MKVFANLFFVAVSVLVLLVLLFQKNFTSILGQNNDDLKANIYFKMATSDQEIAEFKKTILSKYPALKIVDYPREKILADFEKTFSGYGQGIIDNEGIKDLIPDAIEVYSDNTADIKKIKLAYADTTIVDKIDIADEWINKLSHVRTVAVTFLNFVFAFSFLAVTVMSSLLARQLVFLKRTNIEICFLNGADAKSLFQSFFIKSFFSFVLCFGLGLLVIFSVYQFLVHRILLDHELNFISSRIQFLSLQQIVVAFVGLTISYSLGLIQSLLSSFKIVFQGYRQ